MPVSQSHCWRTNIVAADKLRLATTDNVRPHQANESAEVLQWSGLLMLLLLLLAYHPVTTHAYAGGHAQKVPQRRLLEAMQIA